MCLFFFLHNFKSLPFDFLAVCRLLFTLSTLFDNTSSANPSFTSYSTSALCRISSLRFLRSLLSRFQAQQWRPWKYGTISAPN